MHLESLASARCEKCCLTLTAKRLEREIKQLALQEKLRKAYQKIQVVVNPNGQISALARIDILAADTEEPYPIGPNPKFWKGPWKSVTNPDQVVEYFSTIYRRQYNQAVSNPFVHGPLLSLLGYKADTPAIDALLNNEPPPPEILTNHYKETRPILQLLSSPLSIPPPQSISKITSDQFTLLYNSLNEATSSSPSSRHLGHYKVAAKNPPLSTIHSKMMSIPSLLQDGTK